MDNSLRFFSEVLGIVFIGAGYPIYLETEVGGQLVLTLGIILLLISKWPEKHKHGRHKRLRRTSKRTAGSTAVLV